jgi:phage-related protein
MADLDRIRIVVEPDTSDFQRDLNSDLSKVSPQDVEVGVVFETKDAEGNIDKWSRDVNGRLRKNGKFAVEADFKAAEKAMGDFGKKHQGPLRKLLQIDTARGEEALKKFEERAKKTFERVQRVAKFAFLGAGTAAAGVALGAGKQFAELEQNIGGSEAVFGKFAATVQRDGMMAFKNLGLSQSDYLASANKMASLFQGSGLSQQKSLDLTTKAMQRAADVASVMGIDTSVAMESIAGAAKGNFTMMDNLGVAMNDTALQAYILEKNIDIDWKKATPDQKNEIAIKMFLDRTTQYAGNFARESEETISGSFVMMRSSFENFQAALANPDPEAINAAAAQLWQSFQAVVNNVTPVAVRIGKRMAQGILTGLGALVGIEIPTEAIDRLISKIKDVFQALKDTGALDALKSSIQGTVSVVSEAVEFLIKYQDILIPLAAGIGAVVLAQKAWTIALGIHAAATKAFTAVQTALNAVMSANPIGLIVLAVIGLGTALVTAYKRSEKFRNVVDKGWSALKKLWDILMQNKQVFLLLLGPIGMLGALFITLWKHSETFRNSLKLVGEFIVFLGVQLLTFFTSIPGWMTTAFTAIQGWLGQIGGWFQSAFQFVIDTVKMAITTYIKIVTSIPRRTLSAVMALAGRLAGFFRRVWTAAKNITVNIVTAYISFVKSIPGKVLQGLINLATMLWNFATQAWGRFRAATVSLVTGIISFVRGIPGRIVSAIGAVGRLLYDKGKDIFDGFLKGLKFVWKMIEGWLSGLGGLIKKLKGPIDVDRGLLIDEGKAIMSGFHKGLQSKWDGVEGWLSERGGFIKGILSKVGLADVQDKIGKLFTGEIGLGEVTAAIDKHSNGGMHPSSGPADTWAMAQRIAKMFGVSISSFIRPGAITTTGNVRHPATGMAVDFSNAQHPTPEMDRLAAWAYKLIGKAFYQVLYRTMVGGNHFNHVHIGWMPRRFGGRVQAGQGYRIGEQGPEHFIPDTNGFVMSNSMVNKMLALNTGPVAAVAPGVQTRTHAEPVAQDITINMEVNHGVNDANSLMAILAARFQELVRANVTSLAGGVA